MPETIGGGSTPLHLAAERGYDVVSRLLIEKGAQLNPRDKKKYTPLHLAAENGHKAVVTLLLDRGAQINPQDANGHTPLDLACLSERGRTVAEQLRETS